MKEAQQDTEGTGSERTAYHGCPVYAAASIARNGFLASDNTERGHQALQGKDGPLTGAYVTPCAETAWGYSTPHILFEDKDLPAERQRWTRFMFQVIVNTDNRSGKNKDTKNKKNIQLVFPEECVEVTHLHVATNYPPGNGDGRIRSWKPALALTPSSDIYWDQIVKINGKWKTLPRLEGQSASSSERKPPVSCWPDQDHLRKYL